MNEDRTYAYAVDYYNSEVVVIAILKQKLIRVVQTIKHTGSSIDPKRQSEAHPCFIDMTPDHRMVVCDLGTDEKCMWTACRALCGCPCIWDAWASTCIRSAGTKFTGPKA